MKIPVIALCLVISLQINLSRSKHIEDLNFIFRKHENSISYIYGIEASVYYYWVGAIITNTVVLTGFVNKHCSKICRVHVGAKSWEETGIAKMKINKVINLNGKRKLAPQLSIVEFDQTLRYNRTVQPVPLPKHRLRTGEVCALFTWGEYKNLADTDVLDKPLKVFEVIIQKECGAGTFCFKLNNEDDKLDFCDVRNAPIICHGELTGMVFYGGPRKCRRKLRATCIHDFEKWIIANVNSLPPGNVFDDLGFWKL